MSEQEQAPQEETEEAKIPGKAGGPGVIPKNTQQPKIQV